MANFVCPVCGALAKIYASRPMSETAREMFLACANERCEHSFRSIYDVLNTILPSALPADDPERLPPGTVPVLRIRTWKSDRERNDKARERRQHAIESRNQNAAEKKGAAVNEPEARKRARTISGREEHLTRKRLAWVREEMLGDEKQTAHAIGCTEEELKHEGPITVAFARAVKAAYLRFQK